MPQVHIATLVACTVSLVLGVAVAIEDAEVWGQLQWFGYTFFVALLGGAMQHSIARLCTKGA
jgi:hypothetical protein